MAWRVEHSIACNRPMYNEGSARLLKDKGFTIGNSCIREDGQLLIRINDVLMFPWDADDVAHDRATVEQIVKRNEGRVFPTAPL